MLLNLFLFLTGGYQNKKIGLKIKGLTFLRLFNRETNGNQGKNIENIMTQQYDLVCNGFESGGGSIRSHRPDILKAVYKVMGFSEEETQERIGHMLDAFKYGVPPHGGIALGVERNIMNLTGESYLREVQAFPMTRGGQTSVMKAPKELTPEQLAELHLRVDNEKE